MSTYSREQVHAALKNLSKIVKTTTNDSSIFTVLSRAFGNDDSPMLGLVDEALKSSESPDAQAAFDGVYKELAEGDLAIYLQSTHTDMFELFKNCLSEFRAGEYGQSYKYERAKAIEPEFFFPRLFCVKICESGLRNGKRYYFARIVQENGNLEDIPLVCPEENLFVSEEDIENVRAIYSRNVELSTAWLDELLSVKSEELRNFARNLVNDLQADAPTSIAAFDIYGLK